MFVAKQGPTAGYPGTGKGELIIIALHMIHEWSLVYGDKRVIRLEKSMQRGGAAAPKAQPLGVLHSFN